VPSPPRQVNLCTRLSIHIISPCTYTRARARTHTHTHTTLPSRTSSHRTECHPPAPGESMYTTIYPHHLSMHIYACARTHTHYSPPLSSRQEVFPQDGVPSPPRQVSRPFHLHDYLSIHIISPCTYTRARAHTHTTCRLSRPHVFPPECHRLRAR